MRPSAVTLDCPDPLALADFYRRATGLALHPAADGDFAALTGGDGFVLAFQRAEGHRAPTWPGGEVPQQIHLDFAVEDLDGAEALLLESGAVRPERRPGGDRWRVLLDPAGHPFCLTRAGAPPTRPAVADGWRADRIGSALRGENPTVLRRLSAGFAVIGDVQFLPGYAVLLVDDPSVERLSELPRARRTAFLSDMDRLGEAVERACARLDPGFRRVNLEILGNTDTFLHAHVWPRYSWEPADRVGLPVWLYPRERWTDKSHALGPRHDALREAIGEELDRLAP
jgi:diadenosine tetraphosphate (Ap4A) HIT family hydrolase